MGVCRRENAYYETKIAGLNGALCFDLGSRRETAFSALITETGQSKTLLKKSIEDSKIAFSSILTLYLSCHSGPSEGISFSTHFSKILHLLSLIH